MTKPSKKVKSESMTFRIDLATKQAIQTAAKDNARTDAGQILFFCKQGLAKYEQEKQGS